MSYDAGILNDFGGGNIQWWHDYIRSLLALSDEHWLDEISRVENELEELKAENERLKEYIGRLEEDVEGCEQALKGNSHD